MKIRKLAAFVLAASMVFADGAAWAGESRLARTEAIVQSEAAVQSEGASSQKAAAAGAESGLEKVPASETEAGMKESLPQTESAKTDGAGTDGAQTEIAINGSAQAESSASTEDRKETETGSTASGTGSTASETETGSTASETETGSTASETETGTIAAEDAGETAAQTPAAPVAVSGAMQMTASIDGQNNLYDSASAQKNIVWVNGIPDGTRIVLQAEVSNVNPETSISFEWTSNQTTAPIVQHPDQVVPAGQTSFTDTCTVTPDAGTYGYFCTITLRDEPEENRKMDHVFAYVIKDPLVVTTQDTRIHIAPYDAAVENSGTASMEVVGSSILASDSFTPDWDDTNVKNFKSKLFENVSSTGGKLDSKAVISGITNDRDTVVCRVSSKYSPDFIYGIRKVTFSIDTVDHTFSEWKTTTEATVWVDGVREKDCKVCGFKTTEKLPKLKPSISSNADSLPMQTGESSDAYKITLARGDYVQKWESADHDICTVSGKYSGDCTIRAGSAVGRTTVTATTATGLTLSVPVIVRKKKVRTESVGNIPQTLTLKKGKRKQLDPVLTPITTQDLPVTYTTSDKKVATVTKNGKIKAKGPGKCKITVTSGKVSVSIRLTVTGVDATKIRKVRRTYNLKKGKTKQLSPGLLPKNATSRLRYKSSDRSVVRVSKTGLIKAKGKGTATVVITAVNLESENVTREITVNVK